MIFEKNNRRLWKKI